MSPNILLVGNYFDSHISSPPVGTGLASRLSKNGRKVLTASRHRNRLYRLADMLATILWRRREYEIAQVDVFSGPAFFWAEASCWVLRLLRKPYVLTLHGGNLPDFAHRWPKRVKRLLQGADAVTAPSLYLKQQMQTLREDIDLIPNPLEVAEYPFRLRCAPRPKLMWLRAFHAIYNPQLAPLVVSKLRTSFPEISLVMIGPDKGDGALSQTERLIQKLGLQECIEIIPGVPKHKVSEHLETADIFINTTNVDNTPVSVLEAMACGLCVVSTDVGGIPYLLESQRNALLVPANAPDAIAAAVKRLLEDQELAARLSQNARRKAEQFDWSAILPRWETLFERIARA
jgi:glycosyltransferase involved in cell wall biosynthesis